MIVARTRERAEPRSFGPEQVGWKCLTLRPATASILTGPVKSGRKVADEAMRASENAAHRGAETAQQALESGLSSVVHSFQRVTDQFTQVLGVAAPQAEELARRASQNIAAISQASTVLTKGAQ